MPDCSLFLRRALGAFLITAGISAVAQADTAPSDYPVFVSQLSNPNDYNLFATSGWDGNWYLGSNTLWIKKFPAIPAGRYSHAYVGARLGRMKMQTSNAKPWEKAAIPGSIFVAVSSTMAWTADQTRLLTTTSDIPLEGGAEEAIEGTNASQWFWTEIPVGSLGAHADHFAALWSSAPELLTVSSSPVLAAGWGGKEVSSWLSHDIHGALPKGQATNANGISYFQPAIALKLIPEGPPHPIQIQIVSWIQGTPDHLRPILTARIAGDSIESAWIECAPANSSKWTRVGRRLWQAPYVFSVDQGALPKGLVQLRVAAVNIWEEESASRPFTVDVSAVPSPSH